MSDDGFDIIEPLFGLVDMFPGVAEVRNMGEAGYHAGSAVYDGLHGDRDGAVNHGAQALWNTINMTPGVPETASGLESMLGFGGRAITAMAGEDPSQFPAGLGDWIGSTAVMGANLAFGADDGPMTGTRAGEVGTGINVVGAPLGLLGLPFGVNFGESVGNLVLDEPTGPTSGASPSAARDLGLGLRALPRAMFPEGGGVDLTPEIFADQY